MLLSTHDSRGSKRKLPRPIVRLPRKHSPQSRNFSTDQKLRKLTFNLEQFMRARQLSTAELLSLICLLPLELLLAEDR